MGPEAPVLGREQGVDLVFRDLFQGDGIVVPDTAPADFLAVAIEKCDRQILLLQPIVRSHIKSWNGEGQHDNRTGQSDGHRFGARLNRGFGIAGYVKPVHEGRKCGVSFA